MLHSETNSFCRALALAPCAVMIVSPQGETLWVNEAFCALSGCQAQEALHRASLSYFEGASSDPQLLQQIDPAQSAGDPLDVEVPFYPATGVMRWVRLRSQSLCESEKPLEALAWFCTDVTDERHRRGLAQLRASLLEPVALIRPLADQLQSLAQGVMALLPGSGVVILLLHNGERLSCGASIGLPQCYLDAIEGAVPGALPGLASLAISRAEPVRVDDLASCSSWSLHGDVLEALEFSASLSHPVVSAGKMLGCIEIYHRPGAISPNAVDEVAAVAASIAAITLQLRGDRDRLRALSCGMKQANLAMAILDARGQVAEINDCFEAQTGFGRADLVGRHLSVLNCSDEDEQGWGSWCQALLSSSGFDGELALRRKSGGSYQAEVTSTVLRDSRGDISHYVSVLKDVTERRESEALLHQLAFFDPMTGLPNRRLLLDRLEMVLASGRRHRRVSALIFVDLDQFKRINDVFGHSVGDTALKLLSQRLETLVREQDTVARLGGDEFVILLPDVGASVSADVSRTVRRVASKLTLSLREPFEIGDHQHHLQASMGITLLPKGLETAEDLLREADIALYRSKAAGLGEVTFFEAGMQLQVQEFADLERDLRHALAHGELFIFLQPQVDVDGRTVAVEALTRWCHPARGFISPVNFIPVAEESGLIVELGAWIFAEVCKLSVRVSAANQMLPMSINVSLRQFQQAGFVQSIKDILDQTGANPENLVLEITESLLGDEMGDAVGVMAELAGLGLQFSIDDFGTGFSNLARLKQMPLRELKIDKSFVQDLAEGNNDAAIVEAILGIAKSLQLSVVAEGVETRAQADFLRARGCDRMQGYLFARPEPAEAVLRPWLEPVVAAGDALRAESKLH
uniref:GGDEF and EAL domain-containing protein n=1 Tax=Marinobacterium profundum TaxID=1714300 RepID=UPI000A554F0A|nr:GGDEF and EAL domain-containing protein [Marinobacterium profundum]